MERDQFSGGGIQVWAGIMFNRRRWGRWSVDGVLQEIHPLGWLEVTDDVEEPFNPASCSPPAAPRTIPEACTALHAEWNQMSIELLNHLGESIACIVGVSV